MIEVFRIYKVELLGEEITVKFFNNGEEWQYSNMQIERGARLSPIKQLSIDAALFEIINEKLEELNNGK